ncbi:GNAT family N-acetyltransferase [Paraphotobacterium marinum]|uniref:GNAT family N-acetyltransferase n=1 Tax=Paraphotobacterium marinum TaxID=1755811 RepID=A0A220VGS2_9GAMM|nr:GNAT family N-acetyltransferase [Paraphotobacterium marinum]ASK79372.1 GNAT family N-acetyltransferase [Paraphotobacterium marinum]
MTSEKLKVNNFKPQPQSETPSKSLCSSRLKYRILTKDDFKYLYSLSSDPDVMKFFPHGTLSEKRTQERHEFYLDCYHKHNLPIFLMFCSKTNEFIGRCGFGLLEEQVEVGYVLHKKFWRQGFASESLQFCLQWAKKNLTTKNIIALAPSDHIGSISVMESCNMQFIEEKIAYGKNCKFYQIRNL